MPVLLEDLAKEGPSIFDFGGEGGPAPVQKFVATLKMLVDATGTVIDKSEEKPSPRQWAQWSPSISAYKSMKRKRKSSINFWGQRPIKPTREPKREAKN